jgi:hypothetical protein
MSQPAQLALVAVYVLGATIVTEGSAPDGRALLAGPTTANRSDSRAVRAVGARSCEG